MFLIPMIMTYISSFLARIPVKLIAAVVVLILGAFALWLGYSHYKDLNTQLSVARQELILAKLEVKTANATIDELKRQALSQAQAFTELERRRQAIAGEQDQLLSQLDEINGDCNALITPPGGLTPDLDALNRINRDANRLLRGQASSP